MLTLCASCRTVFRINADQLRVAAGIVECGQCGSQFNALQRLIDESNPVDVDTTPQDPTVALASADDSPGDEMGLEAEELDPPSGVSSTEQSGDPPQINSAASIMADAPSPAVQQGLSDEDTMAVLSVDQGVSAVEKLSPLSDEELAEVPEILQDPRRSLTSAGRRTNASWIFLSVLFLLLLVGQISWLERQRVFTQIPQTRAFALRLCERLGCNIDGGVTSGIEMLARDVREHPEYRDALLVNATLINRTDYVKAYPIIALALYDHLGNALGLRRFEPHEYLDKSINISDGMPARRPLFVVMEIGAINFDAVSFEFTFL